MNCHRVTGSEGQIMQAANETELSHVRALTHDANGNLTHDGNGKTYTYDAANRLSTIMHGGNVSGFVYDGLGRRVQETLNGLLLKQWIWCMGSAQPCEERDASNNVTKRFYSQGEQIGSTNYYFTYDHLGSVREITNSAGSLMARYDYDPYGRRTLISGTDLADFGFTGDYYHTASGLDLTWFRAYDANLGRWLGRDPIAENGGINLYQYVGNSPVNFMDPLGLTTKGALIGAGIGATIGGWLGGIAGGSGGAIGGTLVAPGVGTVAGGVGGAVEGSVAGASAGAGVGAWIGNLISNMSGGGNYDDYEYKPKTREKQPDPMGGEDRDPTQGKNLTPEQKAAFKQAIEDYKAGEGRGGADNLDQDTLEQILNDVLNNDGGMCDI
jgi:RHS repeat-associated protein